MVNEKGTVSDILAEARAIHFAMQNGAITYKQAKERSKPILQRVNTTIAAIAKKHNVKPKYITFEDLGYDIYRRVIKCSVCKEEDQS